MSPHLCRFLHLMHFDIPAKIRDPQPGRAVFQAGIFQKPSENGKSRHFFYWDSYWDLLGDPKQQQTPGLKQENPSHALEENPVMLLTGDSSQP